MTKTPERIAAEIKATETAIRNRRRWGHRAEVRAYEGDLQRLRDAFVLASGKPFAWNAQGRPVLVGR